jgi:hypothetical protein
MEIGISFGWEKPRIPMFKLEQLRICVSEVLQITLDYLFILTAMATKT